MRYVGFSSEFHDAGLSIIEEDGSVSFATHSERYSKVKYDPRLSYKLMELIKDDDVVTFYEDVSIRSKMHNLRKEVFPDIPTPFAQATFWQHYNTRRSVLCRW